jgi:conjugal transfer pilus assembly protein TraW
VTDPQLREQTLFLMRGWDDSTQGFPKTVSTLYRLQPQGKYKVSVAVDPSWFEKLHVRQVPDVLVVNEPNMGMIEGDGLSIRDAVARIRAQKDLNKTYGKVWRVTEPDPMTELKNKVAQTNWQKVQDQAGAQMWQGVAAKAPEMPEVHSSATSYFNPSIVATRTIRLPDGRVVVHKGDLINPLAQPLPWQSLRYISFNADKPWEIRQALQWSQEYPTAKVLMAAPPATTQGWSQLEQTFGKPLFVLEPAVAERLGIRALPSMTWPHGLVLQTYTQGIPAHASTVVPQEAQP